MTFDINWEDGIYAKQRQVNRFPFDWVVSTVNRLFSDIKSDSKLNALELGCGTGNNLKFLLDFGFHNVHGIDGSKTALQIADQYIDDTGDNLKLIPADFAAIPEADEYYDLILDRGSITHNDFKSCQIIFDEAYRVLKPGGFFMSALFSSSHSAVYNAEQISPSFYNAFENETAIENGLMTSFFSQQDILTLFSPFEILSCILSNQEEMVSKPSRVSMWYVIAKKPRPND